ncbi:FAD-binding oxidoreductase [Amylibacter sp. IMCC11727]|uniref:NAD(P)/FAD-dependent oxidoreductase n=1 Tax=Amylibacter sp. IMCC11727 TaxID=3039851 RepID=UPI00244DD395|nr:FAD-binding oxidoreductase [Amylibacter sp. IMCC11727]WGI22884.1 FAD-binding oxidoreductase [Amylibacter sp. IMCC11727]
MQKPIVVIGAGMVGVSTAIWLQRAGQRVILMDRGKPGMGASYGNAGLIAQWAVVPVNTPSLWKDTPKYLINPNSPLFLKWTHLPKMLPWIAKFMSNANAADAQRMVDNLIPILTDAVDQHKSLVRDTPLEHWITNSKFSYAYPTHADFKHDAYSWDMKRHAGFTPTVLTGKDVQDAEPILGPATGCLAVLEGQGHITNPAQYITEVVAHFTAQGGEFLEAEVQDFTKSNGRITQIETAIGPIECTHAVITAGIWSKDLMRKLGLSIPLETERGYHVIYKNPSQMPDDPMMIAKGKFAVNPMDMGLRCAGTVELGDHHAGPSKQPIKLLKRYAAEVFPALEYSETEEWMGFRPSTPNSTPLIGEIGDTGIFTGFGHQHVGLTAGPKTGRILAQMITGDAPNIDLTPYAPARYLR